MKKKRRQKINDPYAAMEAQRYENPIPSREFILQYLQQNGRPLSHQYLLEAFNLKDEAQIIALQRRLNAMVRDGQLMRNRRGNYGLVTKMNLLRGRVLAQKEGYGFVELDDSNERLYLDPQQMRMVFDGDHVLVRETSTEIRERRYAVVVEILERGIKEFVGRLFSEDGAVFLAPNNTVITRDILIPPQNLKGAVANQIVVVECLIPDVPNFRRQPIGKVLKILGDEITPQSAIDLAIRSHGLRHDWPDEVIAASHKIGKKIPAKAKTKRADLCHYPFVTIDGEDAKDFDDAVFCQKTKEGGWQLFVAIADVSYYVTPNSVFDNEAFLRGNSAYFPGQVVPMLPEVLSNELCSLKPNVERLTHVCEAKISKTGKITRYRFYRAVIRSHARLTYSQVAKLLGDKKSKHPLKAHLLTLYSLFQQLLKQRSKRGAIEFDFPEPRIIFDDDGDIRNVIPASRNDAHRLIEECMLVANVCAANFLLRNDLPSLFRNHDKPKADKVTELKKLVKELGLHLKGGDTPEPLHFSQLLDEVNQRDDAKMLETIVLRSMCQANYSHDNIGHFGLAYKAYTHFTSPIRRYPDLLVHRAIAAICERHTYDYDQEQVSAIAEHCSQTERQAEQASWDVLAWLKCQFMHDKLGEQFHAKVTSVTPFGLFVGLNDHYVEGLIHVTALRNDYYHYDPVRHLLRGERSGQVYKIGDPLEVRLVRVDLDERQIDFDLIPADGERRQTTRRHRRKKKRKK